MSSEEIFFPLQSLIILLLAFSVTTRSLSQDLTKSRVTFEKLFLTRIQKKLPLSRWAEKSQKEGYPRSYKVRSSRAEYTMY